MKQLELTADGSCLGNPGPGGWACVLRFEIQVRELSNGVARRTNDRLELTAVIEGLMVVREPCRVKIFTDSQYLQRGTTEYLPSWKANGWVNSRREPVANRDLWEKLAALAEQHEMEWVRVRGHRGHSDQERCHALAAERARKEAEKTIPAVHG